MNVVPYLPVEAALNAKKVSTNFRFFQKKLNTKNKLIPSLRLFARPFSSFQSPLNFKPKKLRNDPLKDGMLMTESTTTKKLEDILEYEKKTPEVLNQKRSTSDCSDIDFPTKQQRKRPRTIFD